MMMYRKIRLLLTVGCAVVALHAKCFAADVIRVGHFPNITHAQALVGLANGSFQKAQGTTRVEVKTFTAGPSEIEALFAGAIDLAYIGPGPAINGYVKSKGDLVIIAGACSGGASLVVRNDLLIRSPGDFQHKRIASPQLGGTQDIALRSWLSAQGLSPVEKGGNVQVIPMANADQLTFFMQKRIDAAWAPEPWATRLVTEGGGSVYLDERSLWPRRQFTSTVILVRRSFLREHPEWVKKWLEAHVEVTHWIKKNPAEAQRLINQEIKRITTKSLPDAVLSQAMSRLELTVDPLPGSLRKNAQIGFALGFLGRAPVDLKDLLDLQLLNDVLRSKGLPALSS